MFLLMSAHSIGYIKLSSIDRGAIKLWLPCMVLHTAVMYFGSVSLSKLAVPIFIGLQNLTYLFMEFCNLWRSKLLPSLSVQVRQTQSPIIGFPYILSVQGSMQYSLKS
ncbi:transmembrane protein 241-like [Dendronephthya gigantea]|uniref:transmembrane protein 241-like n=1 Tax=Dendronephthya gigantea TaxID=151771 RepID=UPI00106C6230|nr:transmembrane protein 241-like [Dendronephthya gigantea]